VISYDTGSWFSENPGHVGKVAGDNCRYVLFSSLLTKVCAHKRSIAMQRS